MVETTGRASEERFGPNANPGSSLPAQAIVQSALIELD